MAKGKNYGRKRRRLNITLSDQARNFLKNNVTNASRFIDELIKGGETAIQTAIVTISPIGMDPAGFEPAASLSQPKGLRPFRNPRRPAVAYE